MFLGALQIRGKGNVEFHAHIVELLASSNGFSRALFSQVRVFPAGEKVFQIPIALWPMTCQQLVSVPSDSLLHCKLKHFTVGLSRKTDRKALC